MKKHSSDTRVNPTKKSRRPRLKPKSFSPEQEAAMDNVERCHMRTRALIHAARSVLIEDFCDDSARIAIAMEFLESSRYEVRAMDIWRAKAGK